MPRQEPLSLGNTDVHHYLKCRAKCVQDWDGVIRKACQGSEQGGTESERNHTEKMSSRLNPHLWQRGLHSGLWPG